MRYLVLFIAFFSTTLSAQSVPEQETPPNDSTEQNTPIQNTSIQDTPTQDALVQNASAPKQVTKKAPFKSFTGKLIKDRVRMRLQPNLDAHIFKELHKDDLVLVVDEEEDFYACQPPQNLNAYIFRTYVLDDVVEGNNVNVRLDPDITAPVVAQLNTGDPIIGGKPAPQNNKWLQMELPKTVRFYVAKDFVTKAGDATLFSQYQLREKETRQALRTIEASLNQEFEKPFAQIQLAETANKLQEIIVQNKDLPQEVEKAQALMEKMQKLYLAKSLEVKRTEVLKADTLSTNPQKDAVVAVAIEQKPEVTERESTESQNAPNWQNSSWKQQEDEIIAAAIEEGTASGEESFYENEQKAAKRLQGIVKANHRYTKNIPGDFVLINPKTNLPIAYLYSTKVNLQNHLNKEVLVVITDRPNNHFAFPAFFVLEVHE